MNPIFSLCIDYEECVQIKRPEGVRSIYWGRLTIAFEIRLLFVIKGKDRLCIYSEKNCEQDLGVVSSLHGLGNLENSELKFF